MSGAGSDEARLFSESDAELTRSIGVTDLHSDLPLALLKRRFDGDLGTLATDWFPRLRAGGVDVLVCAVYVDSLFLPEGALRRAVQLIDALLEEIALCSDEIALATSQSDVERITGEGKIAALKGTPPIVGVPSLRMCVSGPSRRTV